MFRTGFVGRQFASGLGAGTISGSAPSLNLDFTSGVLDSRITFTRASTATYFDSTGTMQSASNNVARFDYDPASLQMRGLLIEESRTNSVKNSTNVGAASGSPGTLPTSWTSSAAGDGLTQTVVGTGTENGISYLEIRFNGTTTTTSWSLNFGAIQDIAAANGQTWAESFYLKLTAGSTANLSSIQMIQQYYDSTPTFLSAAQQTITPATIGSVLSQSRQAFAATIGVANTAWIYPYLKFNSSSGVAVDLTIRVGGVQLEQGAFPTSYIPTTASAVTRAAESATMPIGSWYNPAAGTFGVEYILPQIPASGTQGGVLRVDDGTSNNDGLIFVSAASQTFVFGVSGGVTQLNNNTGAPVLNTISKSAFTYGGLWTGQTNAGPVSIGTGSTPMVSPTRVALGTSHASLTQWQLDGWMRRVKYWPRALAGGEMQGENMVPSLDIDLRAPTLDPRITFTRASTGSYFNNLGVMQQAGNNVPRLDYDPVTLQPLGLLIEESRTNVFLQGSNLAVSPWGSSGSRNANVGTAPDGTNSATRVNLGAGNGSSITQPLTLAATTTYTLSVYVKPSDQGKLNDYGNQLRIYLTAFFDTVPYGAYAGVTFDPVLGIITRNANGLLASITPVGNGWFRCSVTNTTTAGATIGQGWRLGFSATDIFQNNTGDGFSGLWMWGAQLEVGPAPSSYIPTAGASATRQFDQAVIAVGPWLNPAAISLAGDFMVGQSPNPSTVNSRDVLSLNDGSANNRASLRGQSTGGGSANALLLQSVAGVTNTTGTVFTPGINTTQKMAASFVSGAQAGSGNGGAVLSASIAGMPSGLNSMSLGNAFVPAGTYLNGYVQRARVWPRQLSNAELQAVTR